MFNFLDPKLSPKVTCSSPSMDNYEPDNLIHPNELVRARGYLAYTVIRPPVELDFEFICPVNLAYVSLNSTVGNQKCTGVEVFAKTESSSYISIGKSVYDKDGIMFCNSRRYKKEYPPVGFNEDSKQLCYFKSDSFRTFLNASALKIVIFRTNRSVPCLQSIQVYGTVARTCSQITRDTINRIMGSIPEKLQSRIIKKDKDELKVPNDFIDDLTCEIMAVPMTLPSGKTIDRETLEKHVENEAKFGRKPGDPFTGVKFNDNRKPILNVPLKSRIDMFLLQNCNNPSIVSLKRTTGTSYDSAKRFKHSNGVVKCGGNDCSDPALYVIPCKHNYCRKCLLALSSCANCGEVFSKNQAERFHQQI